MKTYEHRLLRLEERRRTSSVIPVWCEEREEVAAIVDEIVATGEVQAADRSRCQFWEDVRDCPPGTHEQELEALEVA